MTLLRMINNITELLDNKLFCTGIFIDLSKAFDTVDHKLLIRKLSHYGIRGTALQWFIDYLTNRKHYACINKKIQISSCHMWCSTRFNFRSLTIFNHYKLYCLLLKRKED